MLPELVDDIAKSNTGFVVDRILADGAYDSNDTFRCLSHNGIISGTKVRKNSRVRKTAHLSRNLSVLSQRYDLKQWEDSVSYGQRWIDESVFSSMKNIWRTCLFCQNEKHETGTDAQSITA